MRSVRGAVRVPGSWWCALCDNWVHIPANTDPDEIKAKHQEFHKKHNVAKHLLDHPDLAELDEFADSYYLK